MAVVTYNSSSTKADLIALATANGIVVDDTMTKDQIIAAIDAYNAQQSADATATTGSTTTSDASTQTATDAATATESTTTDATAATSTTTSDATAQTTTDAAAAADTTATGDTSTQSGTSTTAATDTTTTSDAAAQSSTDAAAATESTDTGDTAAQSGTETTAATETSSTSDTTQSSAEADYTMYAYAGPSLPRGLLKENAVFRGTLKDVKAYLADVLEQYPQVEKLIVPVKKLAAFSAKVKTPGNVYNKYYNDIVSSIRSTKEV